MIKKILFICTGNACRSPMAELLFEAMISKDRSLQRAGIQVDSAGTYAVLDAATPEAIAVMAEYGLNLNGHQPRSVDSILVDWANLVLVMETRHKHEVLSQFPKAVTKTHLLSEYVGENGDVPDPYGSGIVVYRNCAVRLEFLLNKLADKLKS